MTRRPPRTPHGDWWLPGVPADEREPETPEWARFCERAFAAAPAPVVLGEPANDRAEAEAHFAAVVAPFVAVADVPQVTGPAADLTALLARTVARTMVAEIHRVLGGAGTADDVAAVVRDTATPTGLRALAVRYPVLFRLLAVQATHRAAGVREILAHAAADRPALLTGLLAGGDPGAVVAVESGVGDTHRDGRSVSVVRFADGRRLVHKPRSLAVHVRLGELATITGLDVGPVADVLDRGDHGWAAYVSPAPCDSTAAVARFHWRAGALLAVLHALRTTDLHCENLVAAGEHPVPIDLETVLHPDVSGGAGGAGGAGVEGDADAGTDPARWVLDGSVLRTAMLPRHGGGTGIAGLGTVSAARPSAEAVTWADAGLPTMRLVRRPAAAPVAANRPVLDGVAQSAADWSSAVVDGFRDAYGRLVQHRDALASGPVGAMAATPTRVVLRNTSTYARLLDEATHPALLGTAAAREDVLRQLAAHGDYPAAVVDAEVAQLWHGDVPVFEARPDVAGVHVEGGDTPLVATSGPLHRHALYRLSRSSCERQARIVAAALATAVPATGPAVARSRPASGRGVAGRRLVEPPRIDALGAAVAIADQLVADAIDDGRRCNWLTVYPARTASAALRGGGAGSVLPAGLDLGFGHLGIALFLAETGRLSGATRHGRYARRAVADAVATIRAIEPAQAQLVGPGAAVGLGGIAYGLHRLHRLLPDAGLAAGVDTAVQLLARCDEDADLGIADGRAGGLLALIALAPHLPAAAALVTSRAERLAVAAAGDTSSEDGAGVRFELALALGRAGRLLHRPDLHAAANRLAAGSTAGADALTVAAARAELDPTGFVARRTLARLGERAGAGDVLDGGCAGVLDLLLGEAGGQRPEASGESAGALGAALVRRVQTGALRHPAGVARPGLLDGLAGIGWSLLRLHTPLPGLLTLHPDVAAPSPHPRPVLLPRTAHLARTVHEGVLT